MMKKMLMVLTLLWSAGTMASTTFTAHVKDLSTGAGATGIKIRVELRSTPVGTTVSVPGCPGTLVSVSGVGVIRNLYYDFSPDGTGLISKNIYMNTELTCNGGTSTTFYRIYTIDGATKTFYGDYIISGAFTLESAAPMVTTPTNVAFQYIVGNPVGNALQTISGPITSPKVNGIYAVDGVTYTSFGQATTAACAAGGGTIVLPLATYTQNIIPTLCSHLEFYGTGSNGPASVAGTVINTNITTGNFLDIAGMLDIHFHDIRIHNTSSGATTSQCINLHWGQGIVGERFWCDGNFLNGIVLNPAGASTITNRFSDFQVIVTASGGTACLLDALSSVAQVVNGNVFQNGICSGANAGGGAGVKTTGGGGGGLTYINENRFEGIQTIFGVYGFRFEAGSTWNTYIVGATMEANATGISSVSGNRILAEADEISANTGTNISDPNGNIIFLTGRGTQLIFQQFSLSAAGDMGVRSLSFGTAASNGANTWNFGTGAQIWASGANTMILDNTDTQFIRPILLPEQAAPTTTTGTTWLWDDSTAHRLKMANNNGTPVQVVGSGADINTSDQVIKVNGAAVPASANLTSTNGSGQFTASTAHNISANLTCAAASASGTAYTCSTAQTFTPGDGDFVLLQVDVANTGAATLNVNSSSAAPIKKQGGGTALVANDLIANQDCLMEFDGVNWQMECQGGNAPGAGTVTTVSVVNDTNVTGSVANPTTTPAMTLGWTGQLAIARGGSGQSTAAAARASSGFNIDEITTHGDSIYTILSTDRVVATSASLSVARIWTLPAASTLNAGQTLWVVDAAGGVTASNTLTVQRAGSDTINGGTTVVLASANDGVKLVSDGTSKWSYDLKGVEQGGTGSSTASGARTSLGLAAIAASGSASDLGSGTVPAARLPVPGAATLGGVFSKAAVSHQVLTSISSVDGSIGQAQLASTDISGLINNRSVYNVGCNGTALVNSTVTMPWPGEAIMTCLNTTTTIQMPVTSTGTGKNLRVRCSSGGINASSGVFTIVDNGGNTSLTCTTGTGTTCSDTTHSPAITAGDALLVQFTTQIGETLANCAASFEIQ